MPEHEGLIGAIGAWVGLPDRPDDAVRIHLDVAARPEPGVRRAVLAAVAEVARRYGRMPRRAEVAEAVHRAAADPEPEVRAAAADAQRALDALPPG